MPEKNNKFIKIYIPILLVIFLIILFLLSTSAPNIKFDEKHIIISDGQTVKQVAEALKKENIIRSKSLFIVMNNFYGGKVLKGEYVFNGNDGLFEIIKRIAKADYQIETKSVTFFEGINNRQIAGILKNNFPDFDADKFLELAKNKEGFLFPDTYTFLDNITPENVIEMMEDNFSKKILSISDQISKSKYSIEQIIIMASIIEKEASADTMQEISDILWKRFEIRMPLQVDAPFLYSIGKGTFDLTLSDLDSENPYNTYKYIGLTPTPIGNPGIKSILAAALPRETNHLYFLTGRDGKMYYARNFDEHKKNRTLYLD